MKPPWGFEFADLYLDPQYHSQKKRLAALTAQIPLGRLGKTNDVAGLAVFLGSPDADYATGATFTVDGGLTWFYQEQ